MLSLVKVFWDVTLLSGECFSLLRVTMSWCSASDMASRPQDLNPATLLWEPQVWQLAVFLSDTFEGTVTLMCKVREFHAELWNGARNACNRACVLTLKRETCRTLLAIMMCRCCLFIGLHLLISTQAGLHANWSHCKQHVLVAIYIQFQTTKQGFWVSVPEIRFYGMVWDYEESGKRHKWEIIMVENIREGCLGASQSCS